MPPYGDSFRQGEVVLVHLQNQPTFYARIEALQPDRKKGWWHLSFLILSMPPQLTTWILDDDQIRGADFTIQGNPIRMERVKAPQPIEANEEPKKSEQEDMEKQPGGRVISMFSEEE
jgi:hypothetical protein